jgi:hypothetical protein
MRTHHIGRAPLRTDNDPVPKRVFAGDRIIDAFLCGPLTWAGRGWRSDMSILTTVTSRAFALSDSDPGVLANSAHVLGFSLEDLNTPIALVDRCIALNLTERLRATGVTVVRNYLPFPTNPDLQELYLSGPRLAAGEAT